jgi:DNA-binding LytR/AlgR family response regulator
MNMYNPISDVPVGIEKPRGSDKIFVKIGRRLRIVISTNILYVRAAGDYIDIALISGEIIHTKDKITDFEDKLSMYPFMRIHRSIVINKEYIRVIKANHNNYAFTLSNDEVLHSGPKYRKQIREQFFKDPTQFNN